MRRFIIILSLVLFYSNLDAQGLFIYWNNTEHDSYILKKRYGSDTYELDKMFSAYGFIYYSNVADVEDYYIIPYGGRATSKQFYDTYLHLRPVRTVDMEVVGDTNIGNLLANSALDRINKALEKLYTGYQINFIVRDNYVFNGCNIEDVESGIDNLYDCGLIDENIQYHVIPTKNFSFPNSDISGAEVLRNTIYGGNEVHNVILGDEDILQNNFLFIHEFIHAVSVNNDVHDNVFYELDGLEYREIMHTDFPLYCRFALGRKNFTAVHEIYGADLSEDYAFGVRDRLKECDESPDEYVDIDVEHFCGDDCVLRSSARIFGRLDFKPAVSKSIKSMLENQHRLYFSEVSEKKNYVSRRYNSVLKHQANVLIEKYENEHNIKFDKSQNVFEQVLDLKKQIRSGDLILVEMSDLTTKRFSKNLLRINNYKINVSKNNRTIFQSKILNNSNNILTLGANETIQLNKVQIEHLKTHSRELNFK